MDYLGLAALQAVIEYQSFDTAAQKLFVTQSAVSQRIKSLENDYGEPLLVRLQPYSPTKLGEILLGHFKRVQSLEDTIQSELQGHFSLAKISIAISRDSLETWFLSIINDIKHLFPITIEVIADDQEVTIDYLKKGVVAACASTCKKPTMGCKAEFLGYFNYVLVASPDFKKRYFNNKKQAEKNLLQAPAVKFDMKDELHGEYLKQFFNLSDTHITYHVMPSVAGFRHFALNGYAYALIPEIDIRHELKQKKLINLFPEKIMKMPVYWHTWNIGTKIYQQVNELLVEKAKYLLQQ